MSRMANRSIDPSKDHSHSTTNDASINRKGREYSPEVVRRVGRGESLPVEECLGARDEIEAVIAGSDLLARRGVDFAEADLSREAERERASDD